MQRENKWQDRWEDCGLKARITDVEMFAINHGFAEWKGQLIPEFIQSEITRAVAERDKEWEVKLEKAVEKERNRIESIL
jgi:hypothetical protein